MLRALVIALFLANLAWWAWHTPLLGLGGSDSTEREPQRLARQVNPELIKVLPALPPEPSPPPASAAEPATQCLETGPLDEAGYTAAKQALQSASVAVDAWVEVRRERPASYAVYMGRFPDEEQLRRKREELLRIHVPFESYSASTPAGLAPGYTLGRYPTNDQAQARLKELQAKGVRTARVVVLVPASTEHTLRLDQASPAQQAALAPASAASTSTSASTTGLWRACTSPKP
jgi:hypothetical protein